MATREEQLARLEKLKRLRDLRAQLAATQAPVTQPTTAQPEPKRNAGQRLEDIFGSFPVDVAKGIKGATEAAFSIGQSAIAEPVAGLLGLQDVLTGEGSIKSAETVEEFRKRAEFIPSEEGQQMLQNLGQGLELLSQLPGMDKIIEGAKNTKDFITKVGEITGESLAGEEGRMVGGAIFQGLPQVALELANVRGLRMIDDTAVQAVKRLPDRANRVKAVNQVNGNVERVLELAAPTADELTTAAQAIYRQIDDIGISVKPEAVSSFSSKATEVLRKAGFDAPSHPLVARALTRIDEISGPINTQEIGILRTIAQNATKSAIPNEARIGRILVDQFDDFLTGIKPGQTIGGDVKGLGNLYKNAGELWRRSIKTETIDDLFENAKLGEGSAAQERNLINGFKGLIRANKKTKQFSGPEIESMKRVVKRGKRGSLLNLVGKLDISPQQKLSFLTSIAVTGGLGAGVLGGAGAALGVTLPTIGIVSRKLAERLTRKSSEFARAIVAAGSDGNQIVTEYLARTPKKFRDSAELTELLINRGANVDVLKSRLPFVREAVENAKNFTPEELAISFGLLTPSELPQGEPQ